MATSANTTFVQNLYLNLLQRTADTGGIDYWVARADAGMSAADMAGAFIASPEAQNVTAVLHLYDVFFNRTADSAGLSYWVNALKSGTSLRDIANSFSASSEFQSKFADASTADYVEAIYSNLFGRPGDAAGKAYWVDRIDSGSLTRAEVSLAFSLSPEALSSSGAATRFTESYLVLRAAGTAEPSTSAVETLAGKALSAALAEKVTGYGATLSVTGKLVDGYIKGATVFADANGDGVWNEGEAKATTDDKGNFTLDDAKGALVASGGTDLSTGKAFKGVLKATEGSTMINPLTSLQQAFVEKGLTVAEAELKVAKALGLDASKFDLTTFDPLAASLDTNASAAAQALGAQVQAQAAKIANFMVAAGQTLTGAAGGADKLDTATAGKSLIDAMVNAIDAKSDGVISFSDQSMLQSIVKESVTLSGNSNLIAASAKVTAMASDFAAMSAASADNIDKAVAAGGDVSAMIAKIAQTQVAAQGTMADQMLSAAASGSLSTMKADYTGTAFETAASKAVIGDLNPNSTTDDAAAAASNSSAAATTKPTTPPSSGGGGGGGSSTPVTPTFTVTKSSDGNNVIIFGGTATGDITLSDASTWLTQGGGDGNGGDLTQPGDLVFIRGGIIASVYLDGLVETIDIQLASGQVLKATAELADGLPISGSGSVVLSNEAWDQERNYQFDEILVDTVLEIPGTLNVVAHADVDFGEVEIALESGAELTLSAAQASGRTITGTTGQHGFVKVTGLAANTDLSHVTLTDSPLILTVTSSIDISANANIRATEVQVAIGQTLTLTAAQADDVDLTGAGGVTITGSAVAQIINVATTGTNTITPGAGLDQVTLGDGADTVVINLGEGNGTSDSAPGYGGVAHTIDEVKGFDVGSDKLQLSGGAGVVENGTLTATVGNTGYSVTFSNGLVTAATVGGANITDGNVLIGAMLLVAGTSKKAMAFSAGSDYYILQGNGTTGGDISDIVTKVQLKDGQTLTNLSSILTTPTEPTTFTVTVSDEGEVTFGGTATGNITFTANEGHTATFSRGGVTASTTVPTYADKSIKLAAGQTLSAAAAQVTTMTITGEGTVAVTALEGVVLDSAANGDVGEQATDLSADISNITATNVTASVTTAGSDALLFRGNLGKAVVTINGDGQFLLNTNATLGTASFVVNAGAQLNADDGKLNGVTVSGAGTAAPNITDDIDLSDVTTTSLVGVVHASANISNNANLDNVTAYVVNSVQALTMTAGQADEVEIAGGGGVTITGSTGAQTINVATTGTNTITPGAGLDQVTLGNGADTVVVAGASAGVAEVAAPSAMAATPGQGGAGATETSTIVFGELIAGQSVTVAGKTLTATGAVSAAQVATAFGGGELVNSSFNGTTFTGWTAAAADGVNVTFTSTTANTNVDDLAAVVAGTTAVAAGTASDSAPGENTYDIINSFSLATDKIDLPTTAVLTGVTGAATGITDLTISVSNGLASFAGTAAATASFADKLTGVFAALNTDQKAVVIVHDWDGAGADAASAYLVYGDGVAGNQATDIFVCLVGIDPASISTSAGGAALVIV